MLSYVILISIVVVVSITIFTWLRLIANVEPVVSCEEGTSIIISDYECQGNRFIVTIKNNGRFNVDGFILTVGNNTQRVPLTRLLPFKENTTSEGHLLFKSPLNPGNLNESTFSNLELKPNGQVREVDFNFIRNIKLQPFIINDLKTKIFCESIIRQDIENCKIKDTDE